MWLKAFLGMSAALVSVGVAAAYWFKSAGQEQPLESSAANTPPVACTLDAEQLARRRDELASFWQRAREVHELADGYAFRFGFDAATLEETAQVISGESQCCSFFNYRITARPSDDLLLLEVTGPASAKQLLTASVHGRSEPRSTKADGPDCCAANGTCATLCEPNITTAEKAE